MSSEPVTEYQEDYILDISEEEVWKCEVRASGIYHYNAGDGCNNPPEGFYTGTHLEVIHATNTDIDGNKIEADEEKLQELAGLIDVESFLEQ